MEDFMPFEWEGRHSGSASSPTHPIDPDDLNDAEDGAWPEKRKRFGVLGKRFAQKLSTALNAVGSSTVALGENIGRGALSASELLTDNELRKKGTDVVVTGGLARFQDLKNKLGTIQKGLTKGLQGAGSGLASGPKQMQSVLARVQHRLHQQRLRILLRAAKDDPVDVQIGPQLYEDAPQELRSRLWYALVQNPGIGMAAMTAPDVPDCLSPGAIHYMLKRKSSSTLDAMGEGEEKRSQFGPEGGVGVSLALNASGDVRLALDVTEPEQDTEDLAGLYNEMLMAARRHYREGGTGVASHRGDHGRHAGVPANPMLDHRAGIERYGSENSVVSVGMDEAFIGEWEMVQSWADQDALGRTSCSQRSSARNSNIRLAQDRKTDTPETRRRLGGLLRAMWELDWPIPTIISEDSRYSTLLQISIGQEDVDEVITRDIHRTFPEHPQFGLEDVGQAALFNVLKAYSLHDLEVGYCQGMAFVAGVLLMYLPDEPAFQAFCNLMDTDGPNLRQFYLPGLEGLKFQLALFEELLERKYPNVAKHLKDFGIPPILYASQWFLTAFACPFPTTFASRVIDVMLAEHSQAMLMRTALAVMAECEAEVVELDDFEEIITHIKVEPCQWGTHRTREVLNFAVHSNLLDEELQEAEAVVRAALMPSVKSPSQAPLSPQLLPNSAGQEDAGVPQMSASHRRSRTAVENMDIATELGAQQADMNEEYMAMVLALDMMLDGEGQPDEGPSEPLEDEESR